MHPGPTVGFRIQDKNGIMAYLPDHEPALGPNGLLKDLKWLSGSGLASGVDVLLHDAQYTSEEYKDRMGWGHSSMEDAIQFAALTGAKHLLLTHHDPMHTDASLKAQFKRLKESTSYNLPFKMAVEGMKIEL